MVGRKRYPVLPWKNLCFPNHRYLSEDRSFESRQSDCWTPRKVKTLELVSRNYWWPQMSRYIGQYTATCDLCICTKIQRRLPTGHLEPLPTPDTQWDTISVDFIVELPHSDGHDAIMVVVDSLCKRAHFLPVNTTIMSEGSA